MTVLFNIMMYRIILILILIFTEIPAIAQQPINLKEAVINAFKNNNEIKATEYFLSAQKSEIAIKKSDFHPKLKIEEGYMNTNNPVEVLSLLMNQQRTMPKDLGLADLNRPTPVNNWLTGLYFEQPIYDKKLNVNLDIAKTESSLQTFDYLRQREELAQNVALAYFDVDRDTKIVSVIKKDIEDSEENLKDAKKRFADKKAFYSAILRAETDLINTKQMLVTAQMNLEISKRALGLVLGYNNSVEITTENNPKLILKEENYYNKIALERKDLKSYELEYQKAEKKVKLAEAVYFPTMVLMSSYRTYDSSAPFGWEGYNYAVASFLKWDITDGGKRKNEKLKAQAIANKTFENLESFKKKILFQIFAAFTKVEESRQNLELAKQSYQTAQEGRNIVTEKYKKSLLGLTDLLDSQRNLSTARINQIIQENNYTDSLIRLSFESGNILKDLEIYEDK